MENRGFYQRMIDAFASLYLTRDAKKIDPLLDEYLPDGHGSMILGTSMDEICATREQERTLFVNDLLYWDDLVIDRDGWSLEEAGEYAVLTARARSVAGDRGKLDFPSFRRMLSSVAGGEGSLTQKAVEAELHCLRRDRAKKAPDRPIRITMLLRDREIALLCFDAEKAVAQSDCIYEWPEIKRRLQSLREETTSDFQAAIAREMENRGYADASVAQGSAGFFYGYALSRAEETRDARLAACLAALTCAEDEESLLSARDGMLFALMQYDSSQSLEAVVRFFGVAQEGTILFLHTDFPDY